MAVQLEKMQKHINTLKVLGCISMRAKLSIVYICMNRNNSNICITQLRQKSLYIALHLHRSYFLSSNRSEFARYFANGKYCLALMNDDKIA